MPEGHIRQGYLSALKPFSQITAELCVDMSEFYRRVKHTLTKDVYQGCLFFSR